MRRYRSAVPRTLHHTKRFHRQMFHSGGKTPHASARALGLMRSAHISYAGLRIASTITLGDIYGKFNQDPRSYFKLVNVPRRPKYPVTP